MKKLMNRFLMLFLVCGMMLSLTGCSSDELTGTWETDMDVTDLFNDSFEEALGDYAEDFKAEKLTLALVFTFNEDGTYEMNVDSEEFLDDVLDMKDDYKKAMLSMYSDILASYGVDDVEAYLEENGTDIDVIVDAVFNEETLAEAFAVEGMEGNYKALDGKIFITTDLDEEVSVSSGYFDYEIKDGKLLLDGDTEDTEYEEYFEFPLTFKRVK